MGRQAKTIGNYAAHANADDSNMHDGRVLGLADIAINWCRKNSLWPFFFGLSCCFVEEATTFTAQYDIARFGAEVFRGTPREADVLIVSGTVFKKIAPVVLRLYEQMAEPKWVISMGSCANSGGMYDVYSVVQGVNQIIPVDVYVPGCPPRPEALLHGLTTLQDAIDRNERPTRPIFGFSGGRQGGREDVLVDGTSLFRDTRGPGMNGIPTRGSDVTPPNFYESRCNDMWIPSGTPMSLSRKDDDLLQALQQQFPGDVTVLTDAVDMPTVSIIAARVCDVMQWLKNEAPLRYARLEDLTATDDRTRRYRNENADFTVIYTLTSLDDASCFRVRVPLQGEYPEIPSITSIWPSANWYECEVWDMFGISFSGHPNLTRLIMPRDWKGHPLRKDEIHRATEMPAYTEVEARALQPIDAAELFADVLGKHTGDEEFLLNIGPHHYSTHGLIRFILELHGEEITDMVTEIGYHHRGAEKIAEHQSWHQFIPYTDRLDYLSGTANNLTYLLAVEKLCGITVPDRAQCVRVMLAEFFRLSNHLLWLGTFVQDLGMMTPIFHAFREREMIMDIVETITGARLHPAWLRIGGLAMDLPEGWETMVNDFTRVFDDRIAHYEALITGNPIFRARVKDIGYLNKDNAVDWGITGPNLRASGVAWDLRKTMPYSGYEHFDFEIPTRDAGDCLARYEVRIEEMRQSLRIIQQAVKLMPSGRVKSEDYRYSLPNKEEALKDIESLIHHFVNATRGPKIPPGEAYVATEVARGEQGFYVVSDGLDMPYRLHMRSPGYANVQALPKMTIGHSVADFIAIIGSLDYILADIDR